MKWENTVPKFFVVLIIMGVLLTACSASKEPQPEDAAVGEEYSLSEPVPPSNIGADVNKGAYRDEGDYTRTTEAEPVERMVVKDANLTIIVNDPSSSMDNIASIAEEMGGYVVSESFYEIETESGVEAPQASIMIRVPVEKLNEALEQIKAESDQDPLNQSMTSQDVTGEYVDLESRLTNLEATEEQLLRIMEEADTIDEVLSVHYELARVREDIEVIKGRMKYLETSAKLSSIQVELITDVAVQPLTIGKWEPTGVAKGAVRALIGTLKILANIAIWLLIYVLPVGLILFVFAFLPIRWIVRKARGRKTKTTVDQPAEEPTEDAPKSQ